MAYIPERGKPRAMVRFRVDYLGPTFEGHGTVLNISRTGALIEDADRLLMTGSEIKLRFSFFEGSLPIEIPAEVVRETDQGFGVRFTKLSPRTRSVLGLAIAKLRQSLDDSEGAAVHSDDDEITLLKT